MSDGRGRKSWMWIDLRIWRQMQENPPSVGSLRSFRTGFSASGANKLLEKRSSTYSTGFRANFGACGREFCRSLESNFKIL